MTIEDRGGGYWVPISPSRAAAGPAGRPAARDDAGAWRHTARPGRGTGRLGPGDLFVGGACVALMVGIFLPWFEFGSADTGYYSFDSTALRSWMYLAFFAALAVVAVLVLEGAVAWFRLPLWRWLVLTACAGSLLLTAVCFANKAVGLSWDVGAYVSLVAAVAATSSAAVSATVGAVRRRRFRR